MLLPYLTALNNKKVILGSQSKSRNELMIAQKIKYEVIPSTFKEDLDKNSFTNPAEYNIVLFITYSRRLAEAKWNSYCRDSRRIRFNGIY